MNNIKTILFVSTIVMTLAMTAYAETKNVSGKVYFSLDTSTYVIETDTQFVYINQAAVPAYMTDDMSVIGKAVSLSLPSSAYFAYDKIDDQVALHPAPIENQPSNRVEGDSLVLKGTRLGNHDERYTSVQVGNFVYRLDPMALDAKTKAELSKVGQFVEVKVLGSAIRYAYKLPTENSVPASKTAPHAVHLDGEFIDIRGLANYSFNKDEFIVTVGNEAYRIEKSNLSSDDMKKFSGAAKEISLHVKADSVNVGYQTRVPASVH